MPRAATHTCRPVADILCKPLWGEVDRNRVGELLKCKQIRPQHVRDLDDFLEFRAELEEEGVGPDEIRIRLPAFAAAGESFDKLIRARKALLLIFDAPELAAELAEAISANTVRKVSATRNPAGRTLVHSVAEIDLPSAWRLAIADMRDGLPGEEDSAPPAPEIVKGIARTMRQVAKTASNVGLPVALSVELAIAYERSLKQRQIPLSPYTITKYLQDIKNFAAYIGASPEFQEYIADRFRRQARRSSKKPTRIDLRVAKVPAFKTILSKAFNMLDEAKETIKLDSAHALRNRAAAIALVSPLPLRIADLTLFFGRNITWNGERYHLFIPSTSKTQKEYSTEVHPVFGHFIDQLVLHERPASHLEDAREACLREGRALFVNRSGQPVHRNYVSKSWWRVFGTGSHVARAKIHDEFARLGPRGVELALAACGHRAEPSAEFYRSRTFDTLACDLVRDSLLSDVSDKEWREFFA